MHLNLDISVSITGFTPSALYIKRISPLVVSPGPGFRQQGKQIPNRVKNFGIGSRVASGGSADGFLVDVDNLINMGKAGDLFMLSHTHLRPVEFDSQGRVKNLVDQGGLAGT